MPVGFAVHLRSTGQGRRPDLRGVPAPVRAGVQKALAVDKTRPATRSRTGTHSSIWKGKGRRQTAWRSLPLRPGEALKGVRAPGRHPPHPWGRRWRCGHFGTAHRRTRRGRADGESHWAGTGHLLWRRGGRRGNGHCRSSDRGTWPGRDDGGSDRAGSEGGAADRHRHRLDSTARRGAAGAPRLLLRSLRPAAEECPQAAKPPGAPARRRPPVAGGRPGGGRGLRHRIGAGYAGRHQEHNQGSHVSFILWGKSICSRVGTASRAVPAGPFHQPGRAAGPG
jgi:hypothetical protein